MAVGWQSAWQGFTQGITNAYQSVQQGGIQNALPNLFGSLKTLRFAEPLALWALAIGLVVLLLYLIRPRPKQINIPSLMFFLRRNRVERLTSFFRLIIRDPLMLLHLLIVLLLALSLAKPYLTITENAAAKSKVIILDISASMSTVEGDSTRFDIAKNIALTSLGQSNTIILAADFPIIALIGGSAEDAKTVLGKAQVLDTESAVGDAVMSAVSFISKDSYVTVLSDFQASKGTEPSLALQAISGLAADVNAVSVIAEGAEGSDAENHASSEKSNIGIIDVQYPRASTGKKEFSANVYVKNYDNVQRPVLLKYAGKEFEANAPANGIIALSINLTPGTQVLEALNKDSKDSKDSFPTDNKLFISVPEKVQPKVLYITKSPSKYLLSALHSLEQVSVEIAEPPIVPQGDYDIYIIADVDYDSILPGTFENIQKAVGSGKTLVVVAQDGTGISGGAGTGDAGTSMDTSKLLGMLPYSINGTLDKSGVILGASSPITSSVQFEVVDKFLLVYPTSDATVLAYAGDVPIVSIANVGKGKVLYYGIMEKYSKFHFFPSYPLFWSQFVESVTREESLSVINLRTGSTVAAPAGTKIVLPSGQQIQGSVRMDRIGFYRIIDDSSQPAQGNAGNAQTAQTQDSADSTDSADSALGSATNSATNSASNSVSNSAQKFPIYSASLLSEDESDIKQAGLKGSTTSSSVAAALTPQKVPVKRELSIVPYLLYAALILLFIDLIYVRWRGDF